MANKGSGGKKVAVAGARKKRRAPRLVGVVTPITAVRAARRRETESRSGATWVPAAVRPESAPERPAAKALDDLRRMIFGTTSIATEAKLPKPTAARPAVAPVRPEPAPQRPAAQALDDLRRMIFGTTSVATSMVLPPAPPAPRLGPAAQALEDLRKKIWGAPAKRGVGCEMAARGLDSLQGCVEFMTKHGDLARIRSEVDLTWELAGIAAKMEGGKVCLFERVKGHTIPVLVGLIWNREIVARLFGTTALQLPFLLADAVARWQKQPVDPVVVPTGPAQEVVEPEVNLYAFPIPWHAVKDGGQYLDCGVVIARDPDTGIRNASIFRGLVVAKDRLTVLMDAGRHVRDYYERAEKRDQPLPLTISIGVDPSVYMASIVPASVAPIDTDELGIASELLGEPLTLVRAKTVDCDAVANAQIIIEGLMLPHVREPEGPFAEVTGYYAGRDNRWVVQVTGITRRREPIWHTVLSGKEVFNSVGLIGEAAVYRAVARQVPGVTDVYFSHGGCGFYHAVLQMTKVREGSAKNAIMATFAAFPSLKMVIAVDDDVNIYNAEDVEWALATRWRAETGLIVIPQVFGHELNPSFPDGIGTKIGIDATAPHPRDARYERVTYLDVDLRSHEIV